jgi:hypothetical protein
MRRWRDNFLRATADKKCRSACAPSHLCLQQTELVAAYPVLRFLAPEDLIRVGLGRSLPVDNNTPLRVISGISLPISTYISGLGGALLPSFVIIMNLISYLLLF